MCQHIYCWRKMHVFSILKLKNARDSHRSQQVMPLWPWCDLERYPPRMQLSWPRRWRRPGSRPRATALGSRTRPRRCGRRSGGGTAAKWAEQKRRETETCWKSTSFDYKWLWIHSRWLDHLTWYGITVVTLGNDSRLRLQSQLDNQLVFFLTLPTILPVTPIPFRMVTLTMVGIPP